MHERRFRRVPFAAEVELSCGDDSWTCELLDIALKGALVATDDLPAIALGTGCNLAISLTDSPLCLDFNAELVHREDDHYGFKFLSEDLDTMTHLRKLIELNTGDVEATRSELSSWLET